MALIASRELRNDTAGVLRRVGAGEEVIVTVNGLPVAEIVPLRSRPARMTRSDLMDLLDHAQADPGLRDDLARLADSNADFPEPLQ